MLTSKLYRHLSKLPVEISAIRNVFKTADGKPRDPLTIRNTDIIVNPEGELVDQFMEAYGNQRLNFKKEDIEWWKDCFGDRYQLLFICKKATKQIVHTTHYIDYPPVDPNFDSVHQYQGFFWVHPDYRGIDSMRMTDYNAKFRMNNRSDNAIAQCFPQSMNLWKKMHGHDKYGHIQSTSFYKPSEMMLPENLNLDGIHVKNALEVPDKDIVEYDQAVFPYERSKYMLSLLRKSDSFGKVAYNDEGKVIGFGTLIIYPSGECVLAPLYADDQRVAQAIFKSILEQIPLENEKLLRFHIRTVDKCQGGFEWIQPFVKCPIRQEKTAYLTYITHPPTINYKKVFAISPYTTGAV